MNVSPGFIMIHGKYDNIRKLGLHRGVLLLSSCLHRVLSLSLHDGSLPGLGSPASGQGTPSRRPELATYRTLAGGGERTNWYSTPARVLAKKGGCRGISPDNLVC